MQQLITTTFFSGFFLFDVHSKMYKLQIFESKQPS